MIRLFLFCELDKQVFGKLMQVCIQYFSNIEFTRSNVEMQRTLNISFLLVCFTRVYNVFYFAIANGNYEFQTIEEFLQVKTLSNRSRQVRQISHYNSTIISSPIEERIRKFRESLMVKKKSKLRQNNSVHYNFKTRDKFRKPTSITGNQITANINVIIRIGNKLFIHQCT